MVAKVRSRTRPLWGWFCGVTLVAGLSAALVPVRSDIARASPALALVVPIVVAGLLGGRVAALAVVPVAVLAFNVAFIPPHWTLSVDALDDGVALAVFGLVAVVVGTLVAREGERRQSAEERAAELLALNTELQAVQRERERLAEEAMRAVVLERIDEQRAALLRSVSHDLRTPLATIRAVVSDLLSGAPYDAETRADLLTLVADEAERLDRLVANLPHVGPRPVRPPESRAPNTAERSNEVPAQRPDLLRRLWRPDGFAAARQGHQAVRVRRESRGPPTLHPRPAPR